MKQLKTLIIAASAILATGFLPNEQKVSEEGINIIPAPVEMTLKEGCFRLDKASGFFAPEAEDVAVFFSEKIAASSGKKIVISDKGNIRLIIDKSLDLPDEGYQLSITKSGVSIAAPEKAGLFYGMQTVMQLLPAGIDSPKRVRRLDLSVPCAEIRDYPRFSWRGFLVDPCRHFMTIEDTKKQIDLLSEYKINTMHWHLSDDQGWRIEIKHYPELTETGAFRTEFDGSEYGGYYTQEEIADVVKYAAERFVTIVPEIEMPGHNVAAIRSYPELSCEKKPMGTFYTWGTSDVVLCPGDENTFKFLEDVVNETAALFPGDYFHIGGDECLKNKWVKCPKCQARIKEEGLEADCDFSAEDKLQSYAVRRMEDILKKHGKKLIGWDEILDGGLSPDAAVMSWRGEKGGVTSAKQSHFVVMTPGSEGLYLDHFQGDPKVEPVAFGRYSTLEKTYNYNPVPAELDSLGLGDYVLGAQCNTWSEYLYSEAQREYMMYPRALALAEIAWTPLNKKDFNDFSRRVDNACVRLGLHGLNYHIPLPEQPGGSCDNLAFLDSVKVEFKTTRPEKMVYTLDGKEPGKKSNTYTQPFVFKENAVVKIATVLPSGKMSRARSVTVAKQELIPASVIRDTEKGLDLNMIYGDFVTVEDFEAAPADSERKSVKISEQKEITSQEPWTRDMRNVRFYGAEAVGYINIPMDGIWRFSTDNDQLWIDGNLVVDNNGKVKKFSRGDAEIALAAGLHPVRIVFISNVIGGWTSARNNGGVTYMGPCDDGFRPTTMYRKVGNY